MKEKETEQKVFSYCGIDIIYRVYDLSTLNWEEDSICLPFHIRDIGQTGVDKIVDIIDINHPGFNDEFYQFCDGTLALGTSQAIGIFTSTFHDNEVICMRVGHNLQSDCSLLKYIEESRKHDCTISALLLSAFRSLDFYCKFDYSSVYISYYCGKGKMVYDHLYSLSVRFEENKNGQEKEEQEAETEKEIRDED